MSILSDAMKRELSRSAMTRWSKPPLVPPDQEHRSIDVGGVRFNEASSFIGEWTRQLTGMVVDRLADGYDAYILTFMFQPLPPAGRDAIMRRALEQAYSAVVTRIVRDPNSAGAQARPLIWIGLPDYIVPKRRKHSLRDVVVNDGRHVHVIVLVPPFSRLKQAFEYFVPGHIGLFLREGVHRVNVEPFESTHDRGVRYFTKALTRRRIGYDDVIFLPRSLHELDQPKSHPNHGRPGQVRRAPPI